MEITAERLQFEGGKNVYYGNMGLCPKDKKLKPILWAFFMDILGDALTLAQGWGAECKMRGDYLCQ
jgi:hypothetical protein